MNVTKPSKYMLTCWPTQGAWSFFEAGYPSERGFPPSWESFLISGKCIILFLILNLKFAQNNIECIWLEFKQNKSTPLLVYSIYRNPDDTFRPWLDRYEAMIDNVLDKNFETVIQGEYNIDLNRKQTTWNSLTLS